MVLAINLAMVLFFACLAWALMPQPAMALPKSKRRNPWLTFMATLGRLVLRSPKVESSLRDKLQYAGVMMSPEEFAGIKVVSTLVGILVTMVICSELGQLNPLLLVMGFMIGLFLPDFWMRSRVRRRQRAITHLLPEVVDLLSLSIGAGLDFLGALRRITSVREYQGEPLIEEMSVAIQEIRLGKRRAEALRDMAKRVNLQELTSFVRTVIQADRMGTPIQEVLSIHSEDVRLQRFVRAERAALKSPIKILVPLIFCIMPCVALIVGAPIFLQFMRQHPFQ